MKIVVCPDSFKGSLSAIEVADTIARALSSCYPDSEIIEIPLADGGEGTAELITKYKFPKAIKVEVQDPLKRKISVCFHTDVNGEKAFIESAQIIGLPLLSPEERNPLKASSFGLGETIHKAIEMGCKEITISLGGSATCDGGKGMLEALKNTETNKIKFNIICDVSNPLLGPNGAAKVFAPQKGASHQDIPILEDRLVKLAEEAKQRGLCSDNDIYKEGAGAAGGLGFAFQTFFKADTIKGIEYVFAETDFKNKIIGADLIITGEGKVDNQSLMGKVLSGVLYNAKKGNIPVIALGGIIENHRNLLKAGLKEVFEISDPLLSLNDNMKPETTKKNLRRTIEIMSKSNIFKQNMSKI